MKDLNEVVDAIARQIGMHQGEIDRRKSFLEITAHDTALLRDIHPRLRRMKEEFSQSFTEHLMSFPELRGRLSDPESVARQRAGQEAYFDSLTAGHYGPDYIRERLKVGVVHQRIGLGPKWYIGAYRKYLGDLMNTLWELLHETPAMFLATYGAALKVVCLDMGLALDTYEEAARQEVLQHQRYLEQVMNGMPAGLMVLDDEMVVRSMNPMMQRMLGVSRATLSSSLTLMDLVTCETLRRAVATAQATGAPQDNIVTSWPLAGGALRYFEFNIRRVSLGRENLLLLIGQDVTFAIEATHKLRESEELFRLTFNQAGVGIAHVAPDGRLLRVNQKLCVITGYDEIELRQLTLQQITHPDDLEGDAVPMARLAAGEIGEHAREKRFLHRKGFPVWVNVNVSALRDAARGRFILVAEDISRRKQAEEELMRLANHDALTGLPNRLLLEDRLSQAIAHAHRTHRLVAVMFIDLDRFKNINDSLGHDAGDELIVEIARRIAGSLRDSDTVARQGGDEFVVVLADIGGPDHAAVVAEKILDALFQPLVLEGQEVFPTGSIGISLYPRDGDNPQSLLKNADAAMYRAKARGSNGYQFYVGGMGESVMDHLKLEGALRRALERNELRLHYQPQIDIRTGAIIGVEALLRWQPSGQDLVPPNDFIPIAEETGLIVPIGEWVLAAACAQHKAWREAGLPDLRISVNLSARQFHRQDLARRVAAMLNEAGCGAAWLALEITESDVMENPETAVDILRQLHEMGVHLAIDDFGTGYSSLSYLKRFPIDSLKIDRSFVRDITTDADDAMIVDSVIALAHSMKLKVIAEGVENAHQLAFLSEHGCDEMQGYYFSQPLPAERIVELVRSAQAPAPF